MSERSGAITNANGCPIGSFGAYPNSRLTEPVDRVDHAVLVEDEDPVGDVVEHRLGAHLAVAQRRVEGR